jgi:hypothetical protein
MGEMVLMGPAREAHIHLYQIEFQFRSDKEVYPKIHS